MSLKQRSVSWHTRLGIRHRPSCLSEEEDSSATGRYTNAVRQSDWFPSFLGSLVLSVSSLLSKINQCRLPSAWFTAEIHSDPNSPTTSANFIFCPFFVFCLRFVSQFEGKNTITRADLHFGSDKEIKLVSWPHYHRISWLFIAIFIPRSPPSSLWCRQMWQLFVANVSNCCNWPWLKKLLIIFPLMREKGRWRGNRERRIDGQLERCVASLVVSVTQQCPTG